MQDKNELRGLIYAKFKSVSDFARAINQPRCRIARIIEGEQRPTVTDVQLFADALQLETSYILGLFLS